MSVVAEGKAARLSSGIRGGERDFAPKLNGEPMFHAWQEMFSRLADLAEVEIERHRGTGSGLRPNPAEDKEARDARIRVFDGRHSLFVAYVCGVSEETVRRVRQKAGVSPIMGDSPSG